MALQHVTEKDSVIGPLLEVSERRRGGGVKQKNGNEDDESAGDEESGLGRERFAGQAGVLSQAIPSKTKLGRSVPPAGVAGRR
jgi:hypothetical protein